MYDVFYSNVWYISFTILWIKYVINVAVHLLFLYILNHSVSFFCCYNLFSCSPAVSPHTKTDRRENLVDAVFSNFLFEFTWDETADFLARRSVACGLGIHFDHHSSWPSDTRYLYALFCS
jgi:hypothetical protein